MSMTMDFVRNYVLFIVLQLEMMLSSYQKNVAVKKPARQDSVLDNWTANLAVYVLYLAFNRDGTDFVKLVEMEQIHGQENVALRKPAEQSSVYEHTQTTATADLAVDGNVEGNFHLGSCSITNDTASSWWKVDLLGYYTITSVNIYNRADCCMERLQEFEVRVSTTNPTVFPSREGNLCQYRSAQVTPGGEMLNCSQPVTGRYVSIYKAANSYLTLCEVQVYADETKYFQRDALYSLAGKNKRNNSTVLSFFTTKSKINCISHCSARYQCGGLNIMETSTKILCELLEAAPFGTLSTYYQDGWSCYNRIK